MASRFQPRVKAYRAPKMGGDQPRSAPRTTRRSGRHRQRPTFSEHMSMMFPQRHGGAEDEPAAQPEEVELP